MNKKSIKYAIGILVTLLALWFSFRNLDWQQLTFSFLRVNWFWVAAAVLSSLFTVYALGWRWRLLLEPKIHLSMYSMFQLNIISQYLNIVIPGRFGELARAWLPARQHQVSGSYILGTVVIEKMFDFFAWIILWLSAPAFFAFHNELEARGYKLALIASIFMVAALALIMWKKEMVRQWIEFFTRILPAGLRKKIRDFMDLGMDAFGLLKNIKTTLAFIIYTAFIILLSSLTNYLLFKAFGFHLSLFEALILLLVIMVGNVPPSVPGKIGIFEWMIILGLAVFGINRTDALSYGIMLHLVSYLPKILLGFVYMANLNLSIKKAGTEFGGVNE
ncbi:MAG: lysylphosphatidylglycerol synthase transmembrane domain-containing protein [Candidatus Omnitrophota bacterium]